jgi:hypothetical protein
MGISDLLVGPCELALARATTHYPHPTGLLSMPLGLPEKVGQFKKRLLEKSELSP